MSSYIASQFLYTISELYLTYYAIQFHLAKLKQRTLELRGTMVIQRNEWTHPVSEEW